MSYFEKYNITHCFCVYCNQRIFDKSKRPPHFGYDEKGEHKPGYEELIATLTLKYPLGQPILGEQAEKDFIRLYGAILRLRNILTSFDEFEGNEILSERDFQDYQSIYIDLYQEYRKGAQGDKETINDDIIFEIELVRQIEVNIDYILMLVAKYQASNCQDKNMRLLHNSKKCL